MGHALACLLIIGERMRNAYIEENPVLAGLAATPEDWPWSNATKAKLLEHAPPQRRSEPTCPSSRLLGSQQAGVRSAATRFRICLLRLMTLAGDLSVHSIRCQIDLAWPRDGAAINENPFEKLYIP